MAGETEVVGADETAWTWWAVLKGGWTVRWEGLGRKDNPDESGGGRLFVAMSVCLKSWWLSIGVNSSWPKPFLHRMLSKKGLVLHSLCPDNAG